VVVVGYYKKCPEFDIERYQRTNGVGGGIDICDARRICARVIPSDTETHLESL
jgi:hypothetical protein